MINAIFDYITLYIYHKSGGIRKHEDDYTNDVYILVTTLFELGDRSSIDQAPFLNVLFLLFLSFFLLTSVND